MTCQEVDERLDDWIDGDLEPGAAAEVQAHLAACAECQARERRLRQLLAHAASLPRSVTPFWDLWFDLARRIGRERTWAWAAGWQP